MIMSSLQINEEQFKDVEAGLIIESLGLLPHWVVEYNLLGHDNLVQHMQDSYGFGELYKFDGKVLEDGSYRSGYEDDADLPYVGKTQTKDGIVYFYEYAIIALPTKDGYFITRMD